MFSKLQAAVIGLIFLATASSSNAARPVFLQTYSDDGAGPAVVLVDTIPRPSNKQVCDETLGGTFELLIQNLDAWLVTQEDKHIIDSTNTGDDLVTEQLPKLRLFIDDRPMRTLQPIGWYRDDTSWPWHGKMTPGEAARHRYFLRFALIRDSSDAQSKADWAYVLEKPGLTSQLALTVGIFDPTNNSAVTVPSYVRPGEADLTHQFIFHRLVEDWWFVFGAILLVVALIVFIVFVRRGGLLREPALPVREDGLPPISLGRCQMAFWFFLVVTGFFFLWLITGRGDIDTINSTVLTLLGISAGTALSAALITANTADPEKLRPPQRNFRAEIQAAKEALKEATTAQDKAAANDKINGLKAELDHWRKLHRNQWILDLLCEENDLSKPQIMSFHRFQIIVWTLVLGLIFCSDVLTKLGMPTFDSTLLVLMGISSGTYLGFKFAPAAKATP